MKQWVWHYLEFYSIRSVSSQ